MFLFGVSLVLSVTLIIFSCEKDDPVPDPAATSIQLISGNSQSADVGVALTSPVEVIVKDQNGKVFKGATVNFDVTEGSVSNPTTKTDLEGKAKITWILGSTVGTQTLTVSAFKADGKTVLKGSPITVMATGIAIVVTKVPASVELISGNDQTSDVETSLTEPIVVIVKDQNGDAFKGIEVSFAVSEGTISAATQTTDALGKTYVTWTLGSTVGTQNLLITAFKADGTTQLNGSPVTVNATATEVIKEAASLELRSGKNQRAIIGTKLTQDIIMIVNDSNGDGFPNTQVNFTLTEGSVTNETITTDADGVAANSWTLGSTVGTQTLTISAFKADGTTHLSGSPITVTATGLISGPNSVSLLKGDNQTGKVGLVLPNPIIVIVYKKTGGQYTEGATLNINVTEGSVSETSVVTDDRGQASITWTLGPTVGTQTLIITGFKSDGTTPLERTPLTINATAEEGNETGTVTDYDGNVYKTIKIGNQVWMAENLRVTHFADGTPIKKVTDDTEWTNLSDTDSAYCFVNNVENSEYGIFYTRSAALGDVINSKANPSGVQGISPDGWHIPSNAEWLELLSNSHNNGNYLKEPGTIHWLEPSNGTNQTGFTAFGGGKRLGYDGFWEFKKYGYWWLTDEHTANGTGYSMYIGHYNAMSIGTGYSEAFNNGLTIRCVKD